MTNFVRTVRANPLVQALAAIVLAMGATASISAPLAPGVVSFESEPDHKARLENSMVRFVELVVPKGKATQFHEHRHDVFVVFYGACTVLNEPYGGQAPSAKVAAGAVFFNSAAKGPYVHRVAAVGGETVHNMTLELLMASTGSRKPADSRFPPFELAMENARGRIYRLKLNPGESADAFTRPAGTAVIAISSGRISETIEGKPARNTDLKPGYVHWEENGVDLTIRNTGKTPVELVEIEVY